MVDSSLDGLMVRCSPRMHILDEIGFDSPLRYRIFSVGTHCHIGMRLLIDMPRMIFSGD